MSITITLDNISKFNKRALAELSKLDPHVNLSSAAEIFARMLGFNDVHHEQKALSNTNNIIQHTDDALFDPIKFKPVSSVDKIDINDIVIGKSSIDELFKLITKNNFSIVVENDNLIKINIYNNIWIKIRFGKYKFAKTHYDTEYTESMIRRGSLRDDKINDIFTTMHLARDIDLLLNVEHHVYNRGDFRYFINKIKDIEIDKLSFQYREISNRQNLITIDTDEYIYYTDKTINDLKLGINRLSITRYEKISPTIDYRGQGFLTSSFMGVQDDEEENNDTFDIIEKFKAGEWFIVNIEPAYVEPCSYKYVQSTKNVQIEFDNSSNSNTFGGAYFDIEVTSIDVINPIDDEYNKWLED
jgi:hypothetical protein